MADREIVYRHVVQAWTVGDLRKAIEGVPDDAPLEISTLEEPSSSPRTPVLEADRLVVTSAGWEASLAFVLWSDFPSRDDYIHYERGW